MWRSSCRSVKVALLADVSAETPGAIAWDVSAETPEGPMAAASCCTALRPGASWQWVLRLYLVDSGMNTAMDQICVGYEDKDLQLLTGFLRRTADAARTAAERLTAS